MASSELATLDPALRRFGGLSVLISSAARSPKLTGVYNAHKGAGKGMKDPFLLSPIYL